MSQTNTFIYVFTSCEILQITFQIHVIISHFSYFLQIEEKHFIVMSGTHKIIYQWKQNVRKEKKNTSKQQNAAKHGERQM